MTPPGWAEGLQVRNRAPQISQGWTWQFAHIHSREETRALVELGSTVQPTLRGSAVRAEKSLNNK